MSVATVQRYVSATGEGVVHGLRWLRTDYMHIRLKIYKVYSHQEERLCTRFSPLHCLGTPLASGFLLQLATSLTVAVEGP